MQSPTLFLGINSEGKGGLFLALLFLFLYGRITVWRMENIEGIGNIFSIYSKKDVRN